MVLSYQNTQYQHFKVLSLSLMMCRTKKMTDPAECHTNTHAHTAVCIYRGPGTLIFISQLVLSLRHPLTSTLHHLDFERELYSHILTLKLFALVSPNINISFLKLRLRTRTSPYTRRKSLKKTKKMNEK